MVSEETNYKNDLKNGPFKEYFESGVMKTEAVFKNNQYDGLVTTYFPSGSIRMQGMYKNGVRDGNWKVYKETGELDHEDIYKNGTLMNPKPEKAFRIKLKTTQSLKRGSKQVRSPQLC